MSKQAKDIAKSSNSKPLDLFDVRTWKKGRIIDRLRKKYGGDWKYVPTLGWYGPNGSHVCWVGSVDEFDNPTRATLFHYAPNMAPFVEFL